MRYSGPAREECTNEAVLIARVLSALRKDGWYEVNCVGSHHQFKHPTKPGKVTLKHPDKEIPRKTLDCIERQSGLLFR